MGNSLAKLWAVVHFHTERRADLRKVKHAPPSLGRRCPTIGQGHRDLAQLDEGQRPGLLYPPRVADANRGRDIGSTNKAEEPWLWAQPRTKPAPL